MAPGRSRSPFRSVDPASPAQTQNSPAALAQQLANPVAALVSVPFQLKYDQDIGPRDDGDRWLMNVQPVVPITQ